jgi:GH24 family phage-related lysozyme (muramidase)
MNLDEMRVRLFNGDLEWTPDELTALLDVWELADLNTYRCTDDDRAVCEGYTDEPVGCDKCLVYRMVAALARAEEAL